MPQKTIAIQSLNCTYFLNYSGNQTFLLIKNRDAKKPSAFNKSTSFFPHRVLILTIFGTVEVFSLALNCVGISSPKGILDQPTTGAFAISVSLTVWHVTKLERSFFFPVTKHTGSWTTPVKLQLEAWHNGAQPLRAQFTECATKPKWVWRVAVLAHQGSFLGWWLLCAASSVPQPSWSVKQGLAQSLTHRWENAVSTRFALPKRYPLP